MSLRSHQDRTPPPRRWGSNNQKQTLSLQEFICPQTSITNFVMRRSLTALAEWKISALKHLLVFLIAVLFWLGFFGLFWCSNIDQYWSESNSLEHDRFNKIKAWTAPGQFSSCSKMLSVVSFCSISEICFYCWWLKVGTESTLKGRRAEVARLSESSQLQWMQH